MARRTSSQIQIAVTAYESASGAPLAVGQTIHVNHEECTAGTDSRRRLYITRKLCDGGEISDLAYCHNCGVGFANTGLANHRGAVGLGRGATERALSLEDLNLVLAGTEGFPQEAMVFLAPIMFSHSTKEGGSWGVPDLNELGVGFNRDNGRLVLPIYDALIGSGGEPRPKGAKLLGWQERRLWGNGPKYLTTDGGGLLETTVRLWSTGPPDVIVFVEDYVSAIRVSQAHTGALVVPLLRFKVRAERVAELAKTRLPALVWLDNDRPEVKNESEHLARLWRAFGNKAHWLNHIIEPKLCTGGLPWIKKHVDEHLGKME